MPTGRNSTATAWPLTPEKLRAARIRTAKAARGSSDHRERRKCPRESRDPIPITPGDVASIGRPLGLAKATRRKTTRNDQRLTGKPLLASRACRFASRVLNYALILVVIGELSSLFCCLRARSCGVWRPHFPKHFLADHGDVNLRGNNCVRAWSIPLTLACITITRKRDKSLPFL